jgi:hypothetical protein
MPATLSPALKRCMILHPDFDNTEWLRYIERINDEPAPP